MKLVIGLLSCANHDDRDELVRQTWLKTATELAIPVYFLRGGVVEFRQEQDTLYFPVPDTYTCLPQKTRGWMKWVTEQTDADVIFKADNDSWVCPDRLLDFTTEHADKEFWGNEPGGRWRGYPSGGAGYGVSRRAAAILADHMTAPSGAEDVVATQVLKAHKIRPFFPKPRKFISWGRDAIDRRPTATNSIITTHQIPNELWFRIHRDIYDT
jgi:hypothetical protein